MPQKLSGGCACSAIRYECDADPVIMMNCHCGTAKRRAAALTRLSLWCRKVLLRFAESRVTTKLLLRAAKRPNAGFAQIAAAK
jgi:hypothetical protein